MKQQQEQNQIPCRIFYSTQAGRAKACARRTARIINDSTTALVIINDSKTLQHNQQFPLVQLQNGHGTTFDDALYEFKKKCDNTSTVTMPKSILEQFVQNMKQSGTRIILCFISTTGDGEHTVRVIGWLVDYFFPPFLHF